MANTSIPKGSLEDEIRKLLVELGVPGNIRGHRYLVEALKIAYHEPGIIHEMTKGFYPRVATAVGTTPTKTERCIRHAIEVAWERCDVDVLKAYFGNTVSPLKGKPTNSEFVARCVSIIQQRA